MDKTRLATVTMQTFKALYASVKGDFMLPPNYPGHEHDWEQLDAGLCLCKTCGAEHICFRGECPHIEMEHSEQVCSISGCVVLLSELRAEWGSLDRVHAPPMQLPGLKRGQSLAMLSRRTNTIHDTVESVVRELLDSHKTARCLADEQTRDQARKHACLAKVIREMAHAGGYTPMQRPNMLHLEAKLSWLCRKCRHGGGAGAHHMASPFFCFAFSLCSLIHGLQPPHALMGIKRRVILLCIDNICNLLQSYGWERVERQLQHASRGREFICSMLYLMRMGITYKNQTILQRIDILNTLLPLQIFLPTVFNIRAKSITEGVPSFLLFAHLSITLLLFAHLSITLLLLPGENVIKMDMAKIPL
jgi:hypothetical protein